MLQLKIRSSQLLIVLVMACLGIVWIILPASSQDASTPLHIESDDSRIMQSGVWTRQESPQASGGSYLYSSGGAEDVLTLSFDGTTVEIVYVEHSAFATLVIEIDNVVVRTVATKAETTGFDKRAVIDYLENKAHILRVYGAGGTIAVDAFVAAPLDSMAATRTVDNVAAVGPRASACDVNGLVQRVSVATGGAQVTGTVSWSIALSDDGRYAAFTADSTDIVPGDTNANYDAFVHDRVNCTTTRVSVASDGTQSNGFTSAVALSGDGRFVVFSSTATNLVPQIVQPSQNIYLHDRQTGQTTLISKNAAGEGGNDSSQGPSITPDGRYIGFSSIASDLVPNDFNAHPDSFVFDRVLGQLTLVSVSASGERSNGNSEAAVISDDGRFVAFLSKATNLAPVSTPGVYNAFLRDMQTGEVTLISKSASGETASDHIEAIVISGDGRYAAFHGAALNLMPNHTAGLPHTFRYDRLTGELIAVNVSNDGLDANNYPHGFYTSRLDISRDGRFVVFETTADNLIDNDFGTFQDIFVRDVQAGLTYRINTSALGQQGNADSHSVAISGDGRQILYASYAPNLIADDTNGVQDIFLVQNDMPMLDPSPVSVSSATMDVNALRLTWNDTFADEDGYRIERSSDLIDWFEIESVPANQVTTIDTNATCNDLFYYRVRAYRLDGTFSRYAGASGSGNCTPFAPTNLSVTEVGETSVSLAWDDNSNGETTYYIERRRPGGGLWTQAGAVAANVTTFTDSGLLCLTDYQYQVRAGYGPAGTYSIYSNLVATTTTACVSASTTPSATNTPPILVLPTYTASVTNTRTPLPTDTRTPTSTASVTASPTPFCSGLSVHGVQLSGPYLIVRVQNANFAPVYISGATVEWRSWVSQMYAASANILGRDPHWVGPDYTSPTTMGNGIANGTWFNTPTFWREFAGQDAITSWAVRFANGPVDLSSAGFTIYDFAGTTLSFTWQSTTCVLPLNLATPTPVQSTPTHTPVPNCANFALDFYGFDTAGIVVLQLRNLGSGATMTGFHLIWLKYRPTMYLDTVEAGSLEFGVPGNIPIWSGNDITASTTASEQGGEPTWLNSLFMEAGQTIYIYFDFDGLGGIGPLTDYGAVANDFNGSSVTIGGCVVSIGFALPPTMTPTATPTPTQTQTASITPTATFTSTASVTPTNTHTFTPTNTRTGTLPNPSPTFTSTSTPTRTLIPSSTPTPTATATPTTTATATVSVTATSTSTASITATASVTATATATASITATASTRRRK